MPEKLTLEDMAMYFRVTHNTDYPDKIRKYKVSFYDTVWVGEDHNFHYYASEEFLFDMVERIGKVLGKEKQIQKILRDEMNAS